MSIQFSDAMKQTAARPRWALVAAPVAVLFGALTVLSGGRALFGDEAARAAVGNAVDFVLWFNFIVGFGYVVAGVGLYSWRRWAAPLSAFIAIATLVTFAAFGGHVFFGGVFEMRTVGAMVLRSAIWIAISVAACRALGCYILDGTGMSRWCPLRAPRRGNIGSPQLHAGRG
jgi:hypothetical protein